MLRPWRDHVMSLRRLLTISLVVFGAYPLGSVVLASPSAGEDWKPGWDYLALIPPRKTSTPAGKIEVVVRHQYTVSIFRDFEPYLQQWIKSRPAYIEVVRKPHVHYPHARFQARMFLTLQQLGRADDLNSKL